jgi:hypothetical protein
MSPYIKTPIAARRLNVPYTQLMSLLRHGKITPPQKDTSGDYLWTEEDLAAVRTALAKARRKVRA